MSALGPLRLGEDASLARRRPAGTAARRGLASLAAWLGLALAALAGCATVEVPEATEAPDLTVTAAVSPGETRGERAAQVLHAVESRLLRDFPRATWLDGQPAQADVSLDLQVNSARMTDAPSSQEARTCRRWSEPSKDAKGTLQRLISRSCLDWQVRQIACLTRRYELDVQFRARRQADGRVIASDRKVVASVDRQCGDQVPASAALQADAEARVAAWAVGLLRAPLAGVAAAPAPAPPPPVQPQAAADAPASRELPAASGIAMAHGVEAHALVIGNANYPGSARLANPLNDAEAISRKLREMGFQVTRIDDGDRDTLIRGLGAFQRKAANSQVSVLYYSGHGMQIDGVNYLLPVDIDTRSPSTFKLQGLPMSSVIESYLPGRTRIVFLDACRDNPAAGSTVRGFSRGLAPMQAPAGTLIAYATRDGGVAEDGTGRHSPFTQALLDLIAEPEDISLVLRKVRDRVMRETGGRQQPWEYGSLGGGALVFSRLAHRQP